MKLRSIRLEWKYNPPNYLEEVISISEEGVNVLICNGLAFAEIEPAFFGRNPDISKDLQGIIESRLYAVQILSHKQFSLEGPTRSDIKQDGTKTVYVKAEPFVINASFGNIDLVVRDREGKVVSDTKRERLDRQKWFAEAVDKYRSLDHTLDQMLKSYQKAVEHPNTELVHLYEVRDAILDRLGNKGTAIKCLRLTGREWDTIGELANNPALNQGRHSGKASGLMRDAGPEELNIARKSAANLIKKYLIYLEKLEEEKEP